MSTATIRPATAEDARVLAKLIDIAGEGIPAWLWSRMAKARQTPLDVGEDRARRETGGFSYRNAMVAETGEGVVGLMLGYRLAAPTLTERAQIKDLPVPIRPFVALEHEAVGSFYINALAVLPGRRGAGIGTSLLGAAEECGRKSGAPRMSVQVFSQNVDAARLYNRQGYGRTDERPVLLHPCQPYYDDRVLLLTKEL